MQIEGFICISSDDCYLKLKLNKKSAWALQGKTVLLHTNTFYVSLITLSLVIKLVIVEFYFTTLNKATKMVDEDRRKWSSNCSFVSSLWFVCVRWIAQVTLSGFVILLVHAVSPSNTKVFCRNLSIN